jgi:hypothetical protein
MIMIRMSSMRRSMYRLLLNLKLPLRSRSHLSQ